MKSFPREELSAIKWIDPRPNEETILGDLSIMATVTLTFVDMTFYQMSTGIHNSSFDPYYTALQNLVLIKLHGM